MLKPLLQIFFICWMAARCTSVEDWQWPSEGCNRWFDETECAYHLYCVDRVNIDPYDGYEGCAPLIQFSFNYDRNLMPIFLHLKCANGEYNMMPQFQSNRVLHETVSLDLSYNEYSFNPTITSMPNLLKLNLSGNLLISAKLSNSEELSSLKELDFSYNTIYMIEFNLEENCFLKLEKLNLSHNSINALPDEIFLRFNKIETLDLSHNEISTLNALTFEGLRHVRYLFLAHNRIKDINSCLIRFSQLIELEINNNKINNLRFNDFEKLTLLNKLILRDNILTNIDDNVFSSLIALRHIDLGNNVLNNIDKSAFSNTKTLEIVDLTKNELKTLSTDMFTSNNISVFTVEENKLEGALMKGTFDGLSSVLKLNLSHQYFTSIEDFAFLGLVKVETILLNNNRVKNMSKNSLKSLNKLTFLDLSDNQISNLDFDKEDLENLQTLKMRNNILSQIRSEDFFRLYRLISLDLSRNKIKQIEPYNFKNLDHLIDFQFNNNSLSGILKEKSFYGLVSLPLLDISAGMLTQINNKSFEGLITIRELNISNNDLFEMQFNSFLGTCNLEVLDLSFNKLSTFVINTTNILKLRTLIVSNNFIGIIASDTLKGLSHLSVLILSHNNIENIHKDALINLKDLWHLDLSFNKKLHLDITLLNNAQNLKKLYLSFIKALFTFSDLANISLTHLEMSNSAVSDILTLGINKIKQLDYLNLSTNEIIKVQMGDFANLKDLHILDLSYNIIQFIQPGAFKDNIFLYSLNISHNAINTIGYGVFAGLNVLHTIDMSYNSIDNLDSERFYEVSGLTVLIADFNKINSFRVSEFASLSTLSIGGNPIPCDLLSKLFKSNFLTFRITAITLDESKDNFHGITCNIDNGQINYNLGNYSVYEKIMYNIRDILINISSSKVTEKYVVTENNSKHFDDIVSGIEKSNDGLARLSRILSTLVDGNNETNNLINKLTNTITSKNSLRRSESISVSKENSTSNLNYLVNKMKQDLEDTIAIEKQNVLNELDKKILSLNASLAEPSDASHEALSSTAKSESSMLFMEVCVGIIFVTMIAFALYKLYIFGIFVSRRRSTNSTRNLQDAMDNSTL